MKKTFFAVIVLALVASLTGAAFAESLEGTVKAVDSAQGKLEIVTEAGSSWVAYNAATQWPEGVTNPDSLIGEKVSVATDSTGSATSVAAHEAMGY